VIYLYGWKPPEVEGWGRYWDAGPILFGRLGYAVGGWQQFLGGRYLTRQKWREEFCWRR
jgi:hypothetical protein